MEENIKILEEMIENANVEDADMNNCFGGEHIEAIENLIKGYRELEECKITRERVNDIQEENKRIVDEKYIPKSKVKEKIEELKIDRNVIKKEIEEAKKEKNKEYYADLLGHLQVNYGEKKALSELMEDK